MDMIFEAVCTCSARVTRTTEAAAATWALQHEARNVRRAYAHDTQTRPLACAEPVVGAARNNSRLVYATQGVK